MPVLLVASYGLAAILREYPQAIRQSASAACSHFSPEKRQGVRPSPVLDFGSRIWQTGLVVGAQQMSSESAVRRSIFLAGGDVAQ